MCGKKDAYVHLLIEALLLSDWSYRDNYFICRPSLLHLSDFFRDFSHFSRLYLHGFLVENSHSYLQAMQQVEAEFGKFMIHAHLSIFEIRDSIISALLKQRFAGKIYALGGDFWAAAEKDEPEVMRFLQLPEENLIFVPAASGETLENAARSVTKALDVEITE